jgi:hypothetical protein
MTGFNGIINSVYISGQKELSLFENDLAGGSYARNQTRQASAVYSQRVGIAFGKFYIKI